jgi:TPR repeat protein
LQAARRGSPIAQNRLARILAAGRGVPADPVEAAKWHLIARARGESDVWLEGFLQQLTPEQQQTSKQQAEAWLKTVQPQPRS